LRAAHDEHIRHRRIRGFQMTWNIFDWGKRKDIVGQRDALFTQAEENLRRITDRVRAEVDKAYRKLERTELMISVIRSH